MESDRSAHNMVAHDVSLADTKSWAGQAEACPTHHSYLSATTGLRIGCGPHDFTAEDRVRNSSHHQMAADGIPAGEVIAGECFDDVYEFGGCGVVALGDVQGPPKATKRSLGPGGACPECKIRSSNPLAHARGSVLSCQRNVNARQQIFGSGSHGRV
jgi:hypothetical protein